MGVVIVVAVVVVALVAALMLLSRNRVKRSADSAPIETDRSRPAVAEFHVSDGTARVDFDVPLAEGPIDSVVADVLIREAVEVVRDKRNTLSLEEVHRVFARGRRGESWVEVGNVELDSPGVLPPPMVPDLMPHAARPEFDAFERISDLPSRPPGLADQVSAEGLAPIGPTVRLPQAMEAGLRIQGLDPSSADACALVLGVMRLAGYTIDEQSADTHSGFRHGQRVFLRTVGHSSTDHPELDQHQVARFVADFVSSGADRGLLITEKFSPFEIYERERREPRMRFITRERIQDFVDALSVG